MAAQGKDRIGVLVVRASLEPGPGRRLLVQLLEVNPPGPDRVIGIVDSAWAASRLVNKWLVSLARDGTVTGGTTRLSPDGER